MAKYISLDNLGTFYDQLKQKYQATSDKFGGIKTGYAQNDRNFPVQLDPNGKAYVNVQSCISKWTAAIRKDQWCRLCFVYPKVQNGGCDFIFNVIMHRSGTIYNDTFIIKAHHSKKNSIIKISGSKYGAGVESMYQIRVISAHSGSCLVEIKDTYRQPSDNPGWQAGTTSVALDCSLVPIATDKIIKYTQYTSGETEVDGTVPDAGAVPTITNENGAPISWVDADAYDKQTQWNPTGTEPNCAITEMSVSQTRYTQNIIEKATENHLGGIKTGYSENDKNYKVQVDSNGNAFVNVPWVSGAGGSNVSFTQTQKNGTEIGVLTIDGSTNTLYAPTPSSYSLPQASTNTLGGIKVGTNLSINSNGVLSATDTTYSNATTSNSGLMSATDKTKLNNIAEGANKYELPIASMSGLGGIKTGYQTNLNNRTYPVNVRTTDGVAYVHVPYHPVEWTAAIKKDQWCRLCFVYPKVQNGGCDFILNVIMHRSSTIYNDTFIIKAHHNKKNSIIKINGSKFGAGIESMYQIRVISAHSGSCLVEIKDTYPQPSNDSGWLAGTTSVTLNCSLTPIATDDIIKYTQYTGGELETDGSVPQITDESGTPIAWTDVDAWKGQTKWVNGTNCAITEMTVSQKRYTQNIIEEATENHLGGIKTGYEQNEQNYPVQLDNDGKAFVTVPSTGSTTEGAQVTKVEIGSFDEQTGGYALKPNTIIRIPTDKDTTEIKITQYSQPRPAGQVNTFSAIFTVQNDEFNVHFPGYSDGSGLLKWANGVAPFYSKGDTIEVIITEYKANASDNTPLLATWAKYY